MLCENSKNVVTILLYTFYFGVKGKMLFLCEAREGPRHTIEATANESPCEMMMIVGLCVRGFIVSASLTTTHIMVMIDIHHCRMACSLCFKKLSFSSSLFLLFFTEKQRQ